MRFHGHLAQVLASAVTTQRHLEAWTAIAPQPRFLLTVPDLEAYYNVAAGTIKRIASSVTEYDVNPQWTGRDVQADQV